MRSIPKLCKHRNGLRVVWSCNYQQFAVAVPAGKDPEKILDAVAVGILTGTWHPLVANAAAVRRWKAGLHEKTAGKDIVGDYIDINRGGLTPQWAKQTERLIRDFAAAAGDLETADDAAAARWLDTSRAVATRNQRLVVLKKFYKWAEKKYAWTNPFADLKQRRAVRSQLEIKTYSRAERDAMLEYAAGITRGVAVWVALLAGLRLNEILRLEWPQVDFKAGTLVTQSKRGAPRAVPIAARLRAFLEPLRADAGRVVGVAGAIGMRRIEDRMRRRFPEFRWQTCRHTFCSLLVQAGVSLDKVCAWAGHTPSVARRHYARFVPQAGGDRDIDRA